MCIRDRVYTIYAFTSSLLRCQEILDCFSVEQNAKLDTFSHHVVMKTLLVKETPNKVENHFSLIDVLAPLEISTNHAEQICFLSITIPLSTSELDSSVTAAR